MNFPKHYLFVLAHDKDELYVKGLCYKDLEYILVTEA